MRRHELIGGKYRLVRPLAKGGMGSVWVARHETLDIDVAVKVIARPERAGRTALGRFEREAKTAAQLRSPHVVHVYDFGLANGQPYIVMELLQGEDLATRLSREGPISLAEVASIIGQAAKGLAAAHDLGLVHRDIKPSNIFLAKAHREQLVKVLDFGIVKDLRATQPGTETSTGVIVGSPYYMSPEQTRAGKLDARSDVWSLGAVAYEMSCGMRPFEGASLGDVIARICCLGGGFGVIQLWRLM
jgi:serine/threonine-protein kinase